MGCCFSSGKIESLDPNKPRSCTDLPALIVFVIFVCGLVLLTAASLAQGNPWRLMYGHDSYGNTCGRHNVKYNHPFSGMDLTNRPYLFAMDVTEPFDSVWICVKECPRDSMYSRQQLGMYYLQNNVSFCNYDVSPLHIANKTWVAGSNYGPCPILPVYESTPILHRCVPTFATDLTGDVISRIFGFLNSFDNFEQTLSDLVLSYKQIIMLCIIAFCISLVFVYLIRYIASIVIYLIFGMTIVSGLVGSALLWYVYYVENKTLNQVAQQTNSTRMLLTDAKNEHTILIFAIAASIISVFLTLVICCLWPSIKLVVDLFRQAGRALQSIPFLLVQPLVTFVILLLFLLYWSVVLVYLATSSDISVSQSRSTPSMGSSNSFNFVFVGYNASYPVKYMWLYHLVGLVWVSEFILACQQMVVAGAVAIWYFSRDKTQLGSPILRSIGQLIQYHLGSVALGSFIITLVKVPRLILMYLTQKLRNSQMPCAESMLKCCSCCVWCIERCCKYIHHNAYTVIAIEGQSFCPAARLALNIIANNIAGVSAINVVGDFVLFLAKCGVTAVTAIIAALFFKSSDDLHFYCVPLLLVCVFAFFIAHCFFSVYEMAIDTLFVCYAADQQQHTMEVTDGLTLANGPLFADKQLQAFMRRMHRAEQGQEMVAVRSDSKPWTPDEMPLEIPFIDA